MCVLIGGCCVIITCDIECTCVENKFSVNYQGQSVSKNSQTLNIDKALLITLNTTPEAEQRNTDPKEAHVYKECGAFGSLVV